MSGTSMTGQPSVPPPQPISSSALKSQMQMPPPTHGKPGVPVQQQSMGMSMGYSMNSAETSQPASVVANSSKSQDSLQSSQGSSVPQENSGSRPPSGKQQTLTIQQQFQTAGQQLHQSGQQKTQAADQKRQLDQKRQQSEPKRQDQEILPTIQQQFQAGQHNQANSQKHGQQAGRPGPNQPGPRPAGAHRPAGQGQGQPPPQFHNKMNPTFVGQAIQPGGMLPPQLMMNLRGPPPSGNQRFNGPNPMQQRGNMGQNITPAAAPTAPRPQRASSTVKAQQAKQRQELLAHAQSFLNPAAKKESSPPAKETSGKPEESTPPPAASPSPKPAEEEKPTVTEEKA